MKILPVGAELFQQNRRTSITKLIVVFTQFFKSVQKYTNLDAYFIPLVHVTLVL
jgi:hypothetical protein